MIEIGNLKLNDEGTGLIRCEANAETVSIPDTVTTIKGFAFENCQNLKTVVIPSSVTNIEIAAFKECDNLETVIFQTDALESLPSMIFSNCTKLTNINIPESVIHIGDFAFYECMSLKNVTLPSKLEYIGAAAFKQCRAFTEIHIPDSVSYIGLNAFARCIQLSHVNIPAGLKYFPEDMFTYVGGGGVFGACGDYAFRGEPTKRVLVPCKTYKGFAIKGDQLTCRDFIYEVGKTYEVAEAKCCSTGFHSCQDVLDIFTYYNGKYGEDFVVGDCTVTGDISTEHILIDTKIASTKITVDRILTREELISIINSKMK